MTSAKAANTLKSAVLSGIDVKIMIPNKADHPFIYWINQYYVAELLRLGANIYRYEKNNNLLSEITYKGNKIIKKIIYTYDSYQNLIKIEKYNNGKNYIYERTFTYYE